MELNVILNPRYSIVNKRLLDKKIWKFYELSDPIRLIIKECSKNSLSVFDICHKLEAEFDHCLVVQYIYKLLVDGVILNVPYNLDLEVVF